MARIRRNYENAAMAVLFAPDAEMNEAAVAVLNLAADLDALERRIVENADRMSEIFSRYAAAVREGSQGSAVNPPSSYSGIQECGQDAVRLAEKHGAFYQLVSLLHGSEKAKAVKAAVSASRKVSL